jgi:pimeloyl-[acyl-carrier protein] synthase
MLPSTDQFDPYHLWPDEELWDHYERLRAKRVAKLCVDGRDIYALSRHEDVVAALKDPRFTSAGGPFLHPLPVGAGRIIATDGKEHQAMRRTAAPHVSSKAISGMEPKVRKFVRTLVAGLVQRAAGFDAVKDMAEPLAALLVADLVGLQGDDRRQVLGWVRGATSGSGPRSPHGDAWSQRIAETALHFADLGASGGFRPGSLGERVFASVGQGDTYQLTFRDALSVVHGGFGLAGIDTSVAALSRVLAILGARPDLWEWWLDRIEAGDHTRSGLAAEVVRHQVIFPHVYRATAADVSVGGYAIPQSLITKGVPAYRDNGPRVLLLVGAANHDPDVFPRPRDVDPTRPNLSRQVGFSGPSHHACMGQGLLAMEMTALLDAFAAAGVTRFNVGPAVPEQPFADTRGLTSLPVTVEMN